MRNKGIIWDDEPRLGKMSDVALARLRGCRPCTVTRARQKRGIPKFRAPTAASEYEYDVDLGETVDVAPSTMRSAAELTTLPVAKISIGVEPTPFNDWVREQQADPRKPWEQWPPGARGEVAEVLRRNDSTESGRRLIPCRAMAKRLKDAWEVAVDEPGLEAYCRTGLGRTGGWKHT